MATPLMAGDPFPKEQQLRRGVRKYTRKVASPKRWQQIADAKQGPCRVCGGHGFGANELHHVVPRAIGGSDTEANIVPLCHDCHERVTRRDRTACAALRRSFTDAEYAYVVEKLGEARFEDRYPVRWERA